MTAMTAANHANPPLPFTREAIITQLRRQATNGPAYVQHSATKALAHLKGLYADARLQARQRFDAAQDAVRDAAGQPAQDAPQQPDDGYQRVADLLNGAEPTPEELAHFDTDPSLDDDDAHETEPDDEPP